MFLARHGYEVVGRDIAENMIEIARIVQKEQGIGDNLMFEVGDFEDESASQQFDAVIFFDCLHHADDEAQAIRFAHGALKSGGLMITHEPGEGHSTNPHSIAAMEQFGVNERDMPPHLIIKQALAAGFTRFRVLPMPDDLFRQFYNDGQPRLLSKRGFLRLRRLFRMAFRPSDQASSIVISFKP